MIKYKKIVKYKNILLMGNFFGCVVIDEASVGVVEHLGKYNRTIDPGFNCISGCGIEKVQSRPSLKIMTYDYKVETITKEQLSITIKIGIQLKINIDNDDKAVYNATYKIKNIISQITQLVNEYFRSITRDYTMTELFETKNKISNDLRNYLNTEVQQYGYVITKALIMDIDPPDNVKNTMNLVLESERKRDAMITLANAERESMILKARAEKEAMILKAEANAQTRKLEGEGLAAQRQALANGLKTSMTSLCDKEVHLDPNELTKTILTMQYIDMLNNATHSKNNTFIMQCHPNGINSIEDQVRLANLSSHQ